MLDNFSEELHFAYLKTIFGDFRLFIQGLLEHLLDFVVNGRKSFIEIIITMSNLNKVLCLQKSKTKNLGQNPDNLRHFLMKDFNYDCEEAMKIIDESIIANITNYRFKANYL